MPIYVYYCKKCGCKDECLQKKRERKHPNPLCGECGTEMTRTLTAATLQFKGGGWQTPKPKEEK